MITTVEVERFSLISSQPFDKILAAIKAAIGHPDMPPSPSSSTNALTASTFPMTGWPVSWLLMAVPTPSRSRGISTRKWRPFCRKPPSLCCQAEPEN
jgi:hypothetical protein